ncbi:MAG: vitamin K epoxide reductase family protein [Terrimicrobiaceae bacterium]
MRISTVANWLAALCALVASVVCYQLVLRHVTGLSGPAWFELECSDKPGSAAAGCTEVLASPYSYFPPKLGKNVPAGLPHIPVAFIGLMYYSTLLAWLVGVGRPAYAKRGLHYAAFLLVAYRKWSAKPAESVSVGNCWGELRYVDGSFPRDFFRSRVGTWITWWRWTRVSGSALRTGTLVE